MAGIEGASPEQTPDQQYEAFAEPNLAQLVADSDVLLDNLQSDALKMLGKQEQEEFLQAVKENKNGSQTAFNELKTDIAALDVIEEKFGNLKNYQEFVHFLGGGELSENELEGMYDFVENQGNTARKKLKKDWLPLNRESFVIFADKFWIPTSTQAENRENALNAQAKESYLKALPVLENISGDVELGELVARIKVLENPWLEGDELEAAIEGVEEYLIWPDKQSGQIDIILKALKEQDAENTMQGRPTKYYADFTRSLRDFSPDIARRVEFFDTHYLQSIVADGEPANRLQRRLLEAGLPEAGKVESDGKGTFVSTAADGTEVNVKLDGNHISRSIGLDGVDYPLTTPVETADYSNALGDFEKIKQDIAPKKQASSNALSFLENPLYADIPLSDMKDGLLKILGFKLYNELWVRGATDKVSLTQTLQTNIWNYEQKLDKAQKRFDTKTQEAVARLRERYKENDEKVKTTLKALKYSGLGKLGFDYLLRQIQSNMVHVDIGVSFDPQNTRIEKQNFWETGSDSNNPTKHIENIYRVANKLLTGNPDGIVNDQQVWFSVAQVIRNPDVQQKTDTEIQALLKKSGIWNESTGTDKIAMLAKLGKPIK